MLFRYGATDNGRPRKKAHIYTQEEHGIDPSLLDPDAVDVVRRLRGAGFRAYVVGGAVRDLLVGRHPKDFDVATDAHPPQIRRLFRSARLIGRRFRLVHVYCGPEKYIEVSTFRARGALGTAEHSATPDVNNAYGSIEEDAERRDFTVNALYYCPLDRQVIDYVGGMPDLRARRLRTLVPAEVSFAEDPVRIIRAVKYAALAGFPMPFAMGALIRRTRSSLLECSRERVTEEVYKILSSGNALGVLELAHRLHVFETLFPAIARSLRDGRARFPGSAFGVRVAALDERTGAGEPLGRSAMFGFLFADVVAAQPDLGAGDDPGANLQEFLRSVSEPLFPSKKDLFTAAEMLMPEARHPRYRGGGEGRRGDGEGHSGPRRRRRGGRGAGRDAAHGGTHAAHPHQGGEGHRGGGEDHRGGGGGRAGTSGGTGAPRRRRRRRGGRGRGRGGPPAA